MAKPGMVTKGVTFNINDDDQKELLEFASKRPNVSSYIKRLIQKDMLEKKMEKR